MIRVPPLACLFGRHAELLQFPTTERRALWLSCAACRWESPGWDLAARPPVISAPTSPRTSDARAWPSFNVAAARRLSS